MSSTLFASGTARGGTNLMDMILSVHPQIKVSQDPYLSLFKSYRRALVQTYKNKRIMLEDPLYEYYYSAEQLEIMDLIQNSDLSIKFDETEMPELIESLRNRMILSSPRLIEHLGSLKGDTYKDLYNSAMNIIASGWGVGDIKWIGFNDNWAVEFFTPVAKTFPDSKFIILIRDVRACIASHVRLVEAEAINPLYQYEKDLSMIALTMSFARCWRKQIAFAKHYQSLEMFKDRLLVATYEQLVSNPEEIARRFCDLLDVNYIPEMINTGCFISPDGGPWLPNTNHGNVPRKGIYSNTVNRWKSTLPPDVISLIEFICGPELEMMGYQLENTNFRKFPNEAFNVHAKDHINCQGWRTDNKNPEMDFGYELLRRSSLKGNTTNTELIKKCFLFPELYKLLK